MRDGILAAGNWIADRVKSVDRWPGEGNLCSILAEERAPGGGPANILFDLAAMDSSYPLYAAGRIGEDADGDFLLAEAAKRGIDTSLLRRTPGVATAYTDVISSPGSRTFFHAAGADAFLCAADFDGAEAEAEFFYLGYLLLLRSLDMPDAEFGTGAARLLAVAKKQEIPMFIVGHVNKDGAIAGPKVMEHIVDTVLQFEGDQHYMYRILRSIKNRFGSTAELGIYEMRQNGLREVSNPSELLLTQNHEGLSGVAIAAAIEGVRPFLIETQALVSSAVYGTPQRSATGFDLRRMNMLLAVLEKRAGFKLIQKDVFLNIAGGLKVNDPAIDLAVISSILSSSLDISIEPGVCMAGEVGLSGEIRPVNRIEQRILEAEKLGFSRIIIPHNNLKGFDTAKSKIQIVQVKKVEEAFRQLFG